MKNNPKPSQKQLNFLGWEMGAFFHFGIRSFYPGHVDWDMQAMPLDRFNPEKLDCEQWMRAIREAEMNYAVLVCKHHDGFANWPSAYTEYSVKNTPWKNGGGDVVREFVDACRRWGIHPGLYYSPAQFGSRLKSPREYDDYFIAQVRELLTNYGKIDYLWFDGNGSDGHVYDRTRIVAAIRELQPDILLFNMWDPDTRWAKNELGVAPYPHFYHVSPSREAELCQEEPLRFLPVECDCRIREKNWFFSPDDVSTVKSPWELMGLYDLSVGRGANLLLNIGPGSDGLLPEPDCQALSSFGQALRERFSRPVSCTRERTAAGVRLCLDQPRLISEIVLEENLLSESLVDRFEIDAELYGRPFRLYSGLTIGHKHICHFPPLTVQTLLFSFDGGEPESISVYC